MSFLDGVKGSLGGLLDKAGAAALPLLLEKVFPNGLQGILNQLNDSGLGGQVNSWLGRGANQPISIDELRSALSDQQVRDLAQKMGVPVDQVLELLAGQLPQAVDQQSPDGELKSPSPRPNT